MRPSPIQAKTINFFSISIEPRTLASDDIRGMNFDWNGVNIGSNVRFSEDDDVAKGYLVALDIEITNDKGKVFAPYNLSISAWGLFNFLSGAANKEEELDLVVVNGASLIYGAIRELVTTLTARMPNGELVLPTANFLDQKPSLKANNRPVKKSPSKKIRRS